MKQKTIIIAEAGVNHNGTISIAKKLVDIAAEAGADIIKFQTFTAENLVSKSAAKATYQIENTGTSETQWEMLKKLELGFNDHKTLIAYCKKKKIQFLSTPFDLPSIDLLVELGISIFKIPSGEINNLPFLQKIGKLRKTVILSTGMSELCEIKDAIDILTSEGTDRNKITVLHCNTEYPTPMEDVNLTAMLTIKKELNVAVGYSDHTLGIEIPIAAVAMGATIIEKHFTLDKEMEGPDHVASLAPNELKDMITAIRNIDVALGNGIKKPSFSEQKNIMVARKSIHISKNLFAGQIITQSDLIMKRPGDGISPMKLNDVVGRKSLKNLDADHKISWEDLI